MLVNHRHCLFRHRTCLTGGASSDIRLHRMRERIHARGGSDRLGQTQGNPIVQHGIMRNEGKVVDGILVVLFAVGNHRRKSRFATRTCRGRHGNQRRQFLPDAQQAFHLTHRLVRLDHTCARDFGTVDGRTATESDNRLTGIVEVHLACLFHVVNGRIGYGLIINAGMYACLVELVF